MSGNFPLATIPGMLDDLDTALKWVQSNVDPSAALEHVCCTAWGSRRQGSTCARARVYMWLQLPTLWGLCCAITSLYLFQGLEFGILELWDIGFRVGGFIGLKV